MEVLTRLGVEDLGNDIIEVVLDEETVMIPPSMEDEVWETLHQSHQAVEGMLRRATMTFSGIRKKNKKI